MILFGRPPFKGSLWFALLLAVFLVVLTTVQVQGARSKKSSGLSIFGSSTPKSYSAFDDDDEEDDYVGEDQADEQCDGESCDEESEKPLRGRRVLRKAGQRAAARRARRKMGQRLFMAEDDMGLRDDGGSWHWYLLWGSLLFGTLAALGSGAPYAQILLKTQLIDKFKPVFGTAEKFDPNYEASESETEEEEIVPPAEPPNTNYEEEIRSKSEYLTLEDDFKSEPRATFSWCQSRGLLRSKCPYCDTKVNHDCVSGGQFHCTNCSGKIHVLEGTWFDTKPMEIWKALAIPFHWASGHNHVLASQVLEIPEGVAEIWYKKCRDITDCALKTCDPPGIEAGEGSEVLKDHYIDHDHANCSLYRLGGRGQVVEVDVLDKGSVLDDKFVILCVDRDSGNTLAYPTRARTARAVKQMLTKKLKEGTNIMLSVDEQTGRPNRQYVLPLVKSKLLQIIPARQTLSEEMLPAYVSQVMWARKHEDCSYDHFRIMVNHIAKYYHFG